jgi:hypothetical protein
MCLKQMCGDGGAEEDTDLLRWLDPSEIGEGREELGVW